MAAFQRVIADGRLPGSVLFSDAVVLDCGAFYEARLSGIAAIDPVTGKVVGYEEHNGTFASDALERQVAYVFEQAERVLEQAAEQLGCSASLADLTSALVFLREDYPLAFQRFNDAYVEEFRKRDIGDYPRRTTVMRVTLPEPNALVEIQFEAAFAK